MSFGGTLAVITFTKHSVTLIVSDYDINSNTSQAPNWQLLVTSMSVELSATCFDKLISSKYFQPGWISRYVHRGGG
jgi:hypothetical protein